MEKLYSIIPVKTIVDKNSTLNVLENWDIYGFAPRRIFFINNLSANSLRGGHAHKSCIQILLVIQGEIELYLDNGFDKINLILKPNTDAIKIMPYIWAEQRYIQPSSILCVIASESFNENEYIRDLAEFKKLLNGKT
jgi:hypothetical protein